MPNNSSNYFCLSIQRLQLPNSVIQQAGLSVILSIGCRPPAGNSRMEYYYKDDPSSRATPSSSNPAAALSVTMRRSISQRTSSEDNPPPSTYISRTYSHKNLLAAEAAAAPSTSKKPPVKNFTRKCKSLAKEQKAKLYIMRRCISMLVRREKHWDDDDDCS